MSTTQVEVDSGIPLLTVGGYKCVLRLAILLVTSDVPPKSSLLVYTEIVALLSPIVH